MADKWHTWSFSLRFCGERATISKKENEEIKIPIPERLGQILGHRQDVIFDASRGCSASEIVVLLQPARWKSHILGFEEEKKEFVQVIADKSLTKLLQDPRSHVCLTDAEWADLVICLAYASNPFYVLRDGQFQGLILHSQHDFGDVFTFVYHRTEDQEMHYVRFHTSQFKQIRSTYTFAVAS